MQPPKFCPNCSTGRWVIAFQTFFILNWNFVILDHPQSRLHCSVVLWEFDVDPIFAVGDIVMIIRQFFYDFGSVAGKYLTTLLFGFFWGFESLKIVGCHQHPQKAHPWVKTRHWSHKRLNPSKGSSCGKLPFAPFDRQHTTFYWSAIVNITLTSTVFFSYLTLNNIVTLKSGLEVTHGHSNWYHSKIWL